MAGTGKKKERVDTAGDRGNERRLVIVIESHKTEDDVFRTRGVGGRSGEDGVGVWRGEEEEGTTEEKVNGGDNGGNRDRPTGAEKSGEESECMEDADYDGC